MEFEGSTHRGHACESLVVQGPMWLTYRQWLCVKVRLFFLTVYTTLTHLVIVMPVIGVFFIKNQTGIYPPEDRSKYQ
jgi:hypothetical protein